MAKATEPNAATLKRELETPAESGFRAIGQPMRRKEDHRMLTGAGRFSDDFRAVGETYAAMVHSPYPHARIVGVDAAVSFHGVAIGQHLDEADNLACPLAIHVGGQDPVVPMDEIDATKGAGAPG